MFPNGLSESQNSEAYTPVSGRTRQSIVIPRNAQCSHGMERNISIRARIGRQAETNVTSSAALQKKSRCRPHHYRRGTRANGITKPYPKVQPYVQRRADRPGPSGHPCPWPIGHGVGNAPMQEERAVTPASRPGSRQDVVVTGMIAPIVDPRPHDSEARNNLTARHPSRA